MILYTNIIIKCIYLLQSKYKKIELAFRLEIIIIFKSNKIIK